MNKKWYYFIHVLGTLMLLGPYLWLILDIVDNVDRSKLLLDACLAGPCLLFIGAMWSFVIIINKDDTPSDEDDE